MIYYKKTTPTFTLYRAFDSGNHILIEVLNGPAKGITKIEDQNLYNQILSATTVPPFETTTEEEFNTAKTLILSILNSI